MKNATVGKSLLIFASLVFLSACGDTSARRDFKIWMQEYRTLSRQIVLLRNQMDIGATNVNTDSEYRRLIELANGPAGLMQRLVKIEKGLRKTEKILCQQEMQETINELTAYQNELRAHNPGGQK